MTWGTGVGVTVSRPGGGYSPVCLSCPVPMRLAVVTRYRSEALALLARHVDQAHAGGSRG